MDTKQLIYLLQSVYEDPKTDLKNWKSAEELMVCVILSAQATDKGVNKITPELFSRYKSPQDFANADISELTKIISSINFFQTKAQRIIDANKYLADNYKSEMPKNINDLVKIPGIGRKSANVILQECFGIIEGIVVDTHITRVSNRLCLTNHPKDAIKIEKDLMEKIPKKHWHFFSASVVLHGRYVCKAKKPDCGNCVLNKICPSAFKV